MKESIKIFDNAQFGQIRTSMTEQGEPLFCLADVCKALDLNGGARNVKSRLSAKGVVSINTPTNGGNQQINFITEPNLYKCIFQSRKKEAEAFQDWVCSDVLPSIRKNGGYMVARAEETPEEIMARALVVAKATIEKQQGAILAAQKKAALLDATNQGLTKQVEGLERAKQYLLPGATFANAVKTSEHSILVGELARIIKQNGVEIGQNRLFAWLRDNGYLCKKGEMYNQPTQKAMGMGLFEIKKTVITKPNGDSLVTTTTKVTGKGQVYFVNKFLYDTINTDAIQSKASGMKEDVHTNTTTTATADNKKGGAQ